MFCCGDGNKKDPSYRTYEQLVIFLPVSGHFCHFGLVWAYFRVFLGPTTPQNPPIQLKVLVYVVVLVREKNRASILKF